MDKDKKNSKDKNRAEHTLFYDILDEAGMIHKEMYKLADAIDQYGNMPNSLQSMLGKVYRYEGKTQAEIAAIYHLDIKNTIRYVNELYKRGYVKKVEIEGRKKAIYLTEEGFRINQHFMIERGKMVDIVLSQLPQETLRETGRVMKAIREIVKTYNETQFPDGDFDNM